MANDLRLSVLDRVEIPEPCPVSWRSMQRADDPAVRFCPQCSKNVYNLSAMTRDEAERVLSEHDNLCGRIQHDRRGRIMTRWVPRHTHRWPRWVSAVAASFMALFTYGCSMGGKVCAPNPKPKPGEASPAVAEPSPNGSDQTSANPPFLWDGAETFSNSGPFDQ